MRGVEQIPVVYDAMCAVLEWSGLERWRLWLVRGARGRTLEVGAGTGRNLEKYDATATVLIALEPSKEALSTARSRQGAALLVRGSAEHLPFREGAFDTVVSSLVFCSVNDVPRALGEVKRVLTDRGTLRMLEHVRSTSRLGGWWHDFVQPAWTFVAGGCRPNRKTEQAVESAGFRLTEVRAEGTMRRFVATPSSGTETELPERPVR